MNCELQTPDIFRSCARGFMIFILSKGVLLRPLGNVVYILPPYVITAEELNYVHDVIAESLELVVRLQP